MEIWKEIEGYEGVYQVSNHGNVRSLNYRKTKKVKNLKPQKDKKEYFTVGLCREGRMKWGKIHRLVASAFLPNPDKKPQVNHINGNKSDNRVENLEWATESENQLHAYKTGLKAGSQEWGRTLGKVHGKTPRSQQAERCKRPVIATHIQSGKETLFESAAEVERTMGINHAIVPRVCNGRQKASKGYSFRYMDNGRNKEDDDD